MNVGGGGGSSPGDSQIDSKNYGSIGGGRGKKKKKKGGRKGKGKEHPDMDLELNDPDDPNQFQPLDPEKASL